MRPEAVSQERGAVEATWLRPLLVSSGSDAATRHPRGKREKRKRRPRTPKSYPSVKPRQVQTSRSFGDWGATPLRSATDSLQNEILMTPDCTLVANPMAFAV